jgi:hypothetical protein
MHYVHVLLHRLESRQHSEQQVSYRPASQLTIVVPNIRNNYVDIVATSFRL